MSAPSANKTRYLLRPLLFRDENDPSSVSRRTQPRPGSDARASKATESRSRLALAKVMNVCGGAVVFALDVMTGGVVVARKRARLRATLSRSSSASPMSLLCDSGMTSRASASIGHSSPLLVLNVSRDSSIVMLPIVYERRPTVHRFPLTCTMS